MRRTVSCLLIFLLAQICTTVTHAKGIQIITADRYLDVNTGRIESPAVFVIDGDKILSINSQIMPMTGARTDLGDVTLLPGLMDMHTHITLAQVPDWDIEVVRETAADWSIRGAVNAKKTLMAGFTTIRDVGSWHGFPDVAVMRAINEGLIPGPRMFTSGNMISITGGHCDITGYAPGVLEGSPRSGVADGVDEVLKAVRYQIKHGANVIKVCATAGVMSHEGPSGALQYSEEELRAIVEEAARHGVKVAAHAHGADGILVSARAGINSIDHASTLTRENIREIKRQDTFIVPNMYLVDGMDLSLLPPHIRKKAEDLNPIAERSFQMAIDNKLKIAFGTDSGVYPHGLNAREFYSQVKRGREPIEVIRSATIIAADLLGVDDRGALVEGKLADIIAVKGNPLDDVRTLEDIQFVMKGGTIYKKQ